MAQCRNIGFHFYVPNNAAAVPRTWDVGNCNVLPVAQFELYGPKTAIIKCIYINIRCCRMLWHRPYLQALLT